MTKRQFCFACMCSPTNSNINMIVCWSVGAVTLCGDHDESFRETFYHWRWENSELSFLDWLNDIDAQWEEEVLNYNKEVK